MIDRSKIDVIANDLRSNENKLANKSAVQGCLVVKRVNKWIDDAKHRPIPNMLFSELWYENELAILFADTNIGKSILAMQIADSLSRGEAISNFELSDKQLENRCSDNYKDHYRFHDNFLRGELNAELELPANIKSIEDYLCETLELYVTKNNVEVLIVDNLTYLNNDNEKAKYALHLMKQLKKLTKSFNISILVLSHTPKRDDSKPITKNDLAGSKMLMNFCDSSFAIGASSQNHSYRYIKQIKQRNTEHVYHSDNIILCEIKKESNFLKFQFLNFDSESNHLKSFDSKSIENRDAKMIELIEEGLSNVQIGKEIGIHEATVRQRKAKLGL